MDAAVERGLHRLAIVTRRRKLAFVHQTILHRSPEAVAVGSQGRTAGLPGWLAHVLISTLTENDDARRLAACGRRRDLIRQGSRSARRATQTLARYASQSF